MKQIIVLGGGFGGVSALIKLSKLLSKEDAKITLIDINSYHLFTPSLYEVATSEEPKRNIAIPFSEIFDGKIKFVQGKVKNIDIPNHLIHLTDTTNYSYDFLILALGSETAYFNLPGLKKYALPLKSLEDAVKIREEVEAKYHQKIHKGQSLNIVVGGGGFSGTELVAELIRYRERLSAHHKKPNDLVKISIIQGQDSLLNELDPKISNIAQKRLEKDGVSLSLGERIKSVDEKFVITEDGKKYPYDVFIWTGGVKANSVLIESGFKTNGRGQVSVNENMQVVNSNNIFAIGDIAEFAAPITNKPAPGVVEVAEDEGKVAARNIYAVIKGLKLAQYSYLHIGYVIPLKGRFAVADFKKFRLIGFSGWVIQQLVHLYYLLRILPISKAFRRWNKFEAYLVKNS